MSGLARLAARWGAMVSGSDRRDSRTLDELRREGYDVYVGHDADRAMHADLVVYTSAVAAQDPERQAASAQMERSVFLAEIARLYPTVVAVAGTHGKTTTCGMLCAILDRAHIPYTAHVGGTLAKHTGGTVIAGDEVFVTEACEYQRHFLSLSPTIGVVTNVEYDHPDCYRDLDDVYDAFAAFGANCRALVCRDERLTCTLAHSLTRTYSHISISPDTSNRDTYQLSFMGMDVPFCLHVWGDFNMQNAAYAAAAGLLLGVTPMAVAEGLATYRGADRRQQYVGSYRGMPIYTDYAHHPTEISAVTRAFHGRYRRLAVVFEPHTYTRTTALLDDFARCFDADELYLLPTYAAREAREDTVDEALYGAIVIENKHFAPRDKTLEMLQKTPHKKYDAILFVGAGDIDKLAWDLAMLEQE